jgi:hypothetical protein
MSKIFTSGYKGWARIGLHTLFWLGYVLLASFIFSYQSRFPYYYFLENYLVNLVAYMGFTYITIYILVRRYLFARRYGMFLLAALPVSIVFVLLKLLVNRYIFYSFFIPEIFHPEEWIGAKLFVENFFWLWIPTTLFAALKYFRAWVKTLGEKNELERKQLEAELKLLKAQLHPHFLFNTLNNLYVLALDKSDKTPEVVLKISDLFHYILYECNTDEIDLEKELHLIKNYIDLERLRYDDSLTVSLKTCGNFNGVRLAPMMLFVFVENAFKHGARHDLNTPKIEIDLCVENGNMQFICTNSLPEEYANDAVGDGGVGLPNVKKRLDLMYSDRYKLDISRTEKRYSVKLSIQQKEILTPSN